MLLIKQLLVAIDFNFFSYNGSQLYGPLKSVLFFPKYQFMFFPNSVYSILMFLDSVFFLHLIFLDCFNG